MPGTSRRPRMSWSLTFTRAPSSVTSMTPYCPFSATSEWE
jgi:hypothetical protein